MKKINVNQNPDKTTTIIVTADWHQISTNKQVELLKSKKTNRKSYRKSVTAQNNLVLFYMQYMHACISRRDAKIESIER